MKIEIRERDRRALIGLGAAVVLYALFTLVIFPAVDVLSSAAEIAAQKELDLQKYRRAVVRKGQYAELLDQTRQRLLAGESRLISGANPSLASVEFQTIVEQAADVVGIPLGQRSVSTAKSRDEFFNEITMTLSFECTPNQLTTFLAEIRSAPKLITVRGAQVTPTRIVHEPPKDDFEKKVKVNLMLGAILSGAPGAGV